MTSTPVRIGSVVWSSPKDDVHVGALREASTLQAGNPEMHMADTIVSVSDIGTERVDAATFNH